VIICTSSKVLRILQVLLTGSRQEITQLHVVVSTEAQIEADIQADIRTVINCHAHSVEFRPAISHSLSRSASTKSSLCLAPSRIRT